MAESNEFSLKESLSIGCLQCLQLGFPLDLNRHTDAAAKDQHVLRHLELDFGRQSRQLRERIWNKCFLPENSSCNQTFEPTSAEPSRKEQVLGYKCGKCNKNFSEKGALKQHLDEIHWKIPEKISPQKRFSGQNQAGLYSCPLCEKRFADKSNVLQHLRFVHQRLWRYSCPTCSKGFRDPGDLKKHQDRVHGIAGSQKESLTTPNKRKTLPKPQRKQDKPKRDKMEWSCLKCKKKFSLKCNLKTHILEVHLGEKRFQCQTCGQRFSRKGNMMIHSETHKKVKP